MDVYAERGDLLFDRAQYGAAIKEYLQSLAQNPESAGVHRMLALSFTYLGNNEEAEKHSTESLRLDPENDLMYATRSVVLRRAYKSSEAEKSIRRAIEINPEVADYHAELAFVQLRTYQYKDALTTANAGLAIDPQDLPCLKQKAWALYYNSRLDESLSTVDEILRLNPEHADALCLRGWVYLLQLKDIDAMLAFRESLRLDPTAGIARKGYIRALRAKNPIFGLVYAFLAMRFSLLKKASFISFIPAFLAIVFFKLLGSLLTMIVPHVLNMFLRWDKDGKSILTKAELLGANVMTIWLALAFGLNVYLLIFKKHSDIFSPAIIWLFGMTFLVARILDFSELKFQLDVLKISVLVALFGIVSVMFSQSNNSDFTQNISFICSLIFLASCFLIRLVHWHESIDHW